MVRSRAQAAEGQSKHGGDRWRRGTVACSVRQVGEGLIDGLGWSERVAAEAVDETLSELGDAAGTDSAPPAVAAVLRLALGRLGPAAHHVTGAAAAASTGTARS